MVKAFWNRQWPDFILLSQLKVVSPAGPNWTSCSDKWWMTLLRNWTDVRKSSSHVEKRTLLHNKTAPDDKALIKHSRLFVGGSSSLEKPKPLSKAYILSLASPRNSISASVALTRYGVPWRSKEVHSQPWWRERTAAVQPQTQQSACVHLMFTLMTDCTDYKSPDISFHTVFGLLDIQGKNTSPILGWLTSGTPGTDRNVQPAGQQQQQKEQQPCQRTLSSIWSVPSVFIIQSLIIKSVITDSITVSQWRGPLVQWVEAAKIGWSGRPLRRYDSGTYQQKTAGWAGGQSPRQSDVWWKLLSCPPYRWDMMGGN